MARNLINKKNYAWLISVQGHRSDRSLDRYAHLHAVLREIESTDGRIHARHPWNFDLILSSQFDNGASDGLAIGERGYAFELSTRVRSPFGAKVSGSFLSKIGHWSSDGDFFDFLKTVAKSINISKIIIIDRSTEDYSVAGLDSDEAKTYIESLKSELRALLGAGQAE